MKKLLKSMYESGALGLLVLLLVFAAIATICSGCTSTYARWGGERVVTDLEGRPLVDKQGVVQKVKEPVELSSWRHWTDSLIGQATLGIREKQVDFSLTNYTAQPSDELAKVIDVSLKGTAELAAKVGAAIATSGGSIASDVVKSKIKKAVANFVFALREGFRRIGFDRKEAFDGRIWLGGFDSNFPNGHTDFPPHFHLIPSARDGTQTHHFYVDPKDGRITSDCYQDMSRVMDVWDRVTTFRPGDAFPAFDGHGRVAFRVKLLPDGTGLEVAVEGSPQRFRVAGARPCEAVDVLLPQANAWHAVKTVTVRDDPVAGLMETPEGTIRYDPDRGQRLIDTVH